MNRLASLPVWLPTTPVDPDIDVKETAASFAKRIKGLIKADFCENAVWRDLFALTGTARTFYSADSVATAWQETCKQSSARAFKIDTTSAQLVTLPNRSSWIDCTFSFETTKTPAVSCTGLLSLVPGTDGSWKIWVLRTVLNQLKGDHGDVDRFEPGARDEETNHAAKLVRYDCIVVGGGFAGLCVAGRLKALGISYVVLDKNKTVGDAWKLRYKSTKLHTTREYSHLPFDRTFPKDRFSEFLTKDEMAQGYQEWAQKFDVNIWLGASLESGSWDAEKKKWTLVYEQDGGTQTVRCSHLILALGAGSQIPKYPSIANMVQRPI